jgi:GTPase
MQNKTPRVALIGRANVGKSSLFNRMIEEQKSLVSDIPGTTRDRFEADCIWRGHVIRLIDTGGLDANRLNEIEKDIVEQAEIAIKEADALFFVVDLTAPPSPEDFAIAHRLKTLKKPVLVIGNKADTAKIRAAINESAWKAWPLAKPLPVSAKQGTGVGDVLEEAREVLIKANIPPAPITSISPMRVAVFGEPNVGKSTLLNALLGEKRFITANAPHTTRQPNDVTVEHDGHIYQFIDTAGIRKHASMMRSGTHLEKIGVDKTMETIAKADVALFVVDITRGITAQDRHLAGILGEEGLSTIIIANKWDLIPHKTTTSINDYEKTIRGFLPQLKYAPVLFTSALTGQRAKDIYELVNHVFATRFTQLSDDEATSFMSRAIARHKPSRGKGVKHPRISKFFQSKVNPPTFTLFVNLSRKDALADSYLRFLENILREQYDFTGTPLRIRVETGRKSHTTY